MKQYMPKKTIKRGLKIWMRSDSTNGYVCQFQVYTGKEGDKADVGLGGKVVTALSRDLVGKNYHLYMDNFFSSIPLFHQLLDDGIYACGTLRSNRKFFPEDLKPLVKRGLPKRGDIQVRQNGNLVVALWQDNKPVVMLSTNSNPSTPCEVKRRQKDGSCVPVRCPTAISMYNQHMGGVDLGDQLRGHYQVRLKSRKMYKYIFWFLLEVSVLNTYILRLFVPAVGKSFPNYKEFRVELAKLLVGDYIGRKRIGRPSLIPAPSAKKPNLTHFPRKTNTGRCHYCYSRGIRRSTSWICTGCNKRLCHTGVDETDCFMQYHVDTDLFDRT